MHTAPRRPEEGRQASGTAIHGVEQEGVLGIADLVRPKVRTYLEAHKDQHVAWSSRLDLARHLTDEIERVMLEEVLCMTRFNQSRAAQMLGMHRNTLRRRLQSLAIDLNKLASTAVAEARTCGLAVATQNS